MAMRSETVDVWERHRRRQVKAARQERLECHGGWLEVVTAIGLSGMLLAALLILGPLPGVVVPLLLG